MKYAVRLLFAFSVCVASLATSLVAADATHSGIVKSKPAEGRCVKTDSGYMVPYKVTIPGTAKMVGG